MNYPLKSSSRPRNKNRRLKAVAVILLLIGLFFLFRADILKGIFNGIATPFWKIDNYVSGGFSKFFSIIGSKKSLIIENRRLEEELSNASVGSSMQKVVQKENEDLKTLLGRNDAKIKTVLSAVLVKPSISPFDVIIIDIGQDKGIQKGDKVLYKDAITIGQVEEVSAHSSKVKLYSSPGEKFTAFIGAKSIQTEAEGLGGGNFMAKLPRDVEVNEGDEAVVPSISTSVFGFAEKIEAGPADSFQKIIFKIPLNLAELRWVLVEVR